MPRKNTNPKPTGRPSAYSDSLAAVICAELAAGKSLVTVCAAEDMPHRATVMRWLADDSKEGFRDNYMRAREAQADFYAEQIIEISDDGRNDTYKDDKGNVVVDHDVIARSRLRVDARKWYASKVAPKKYGDKLAVGGAEDLGPLTVQVVRFAGNQASE